MPNNSSLTHKVNVSTVQQIVHIVTIKWILQELKTLFVMNVLPHMLKMLQVNVFKILIGKCIKSLALMAATRLTVYGNQIYRRNYANNVQLKQR